MLADYRKNIIFVTEEIYCFLSLLHRESRTLFKWDKREQEVFRRLCAQSADASFPVRTPSGFRP